MKKIIAISFALLFLSSCGIVENVQNPTEKSTEKSSESSDVSTSIVNANSTTESQADRVQNTSPAESGEVPSTTLQTNTAVSSAVRGDSAIQTSIWSVVTAVTAVQNTVANGNGNVSNSNTSPVQVNSVQTSAKTTTVTSTPVVVNPASEVENHLANMTLHQKICQMFIVTPESIDGYDNTTYIDCNFHTGYEQYPVGGIILFSDNIQDSGQTAVMITDMQNDALFAGTGTFIAVDEEGGNITRVQEKLGTPAVYNMEYYGSVNDWQTAYSVGETIGSYLAEYGFNLDFAPVADVNINPYNELGSRIFSTDPQIVSDMSSAVVDGLQSQGICSTLKHFPGLGAGNNNTHYGSVWIDRTYEQLAECEFTAFRGGIQAGSEFVMVGHQITSASGDNMPGDLSHVVVTDWLRNELGFEGIAVTDSHSMGAIADNYTSADSAVLAVEAGIDMILMPYNLSEAVAGLENAVETGRISESRIDESVMRILQKKSELGLI